MSRQIQPESPKAKISRVEVYWTAVTYKTVAIYVSLIFVIVFAAVYLVFPEWYINAYNKVTTLDSNPTAPANVPLKQARFVNLDGKVQVKKANSVQWVNADYHITLDKGDQIQTGPDGAARLTFADATTYTVKSDSFITVEQNTVGPDRPSSTAINVKTGAVDLTTPNYPSPDSKAALSIEDTVASVRQNSRVSAKTDPANNTSDFIVAQGSADVKRGDEHIGLVAFEKASFSKGGPLQKGTVLAPPELSEPMNLQPLIVDDPRTTPIHFEWKSVPDAVLYDLRVSNTSSFSKVLAGKKSNVTSLVITGLEAGDYFWNVTAIDAKKRISEASETFKFTLVAQGKSQEMLLEIEGTQLHGKVAEIIGRTEPGAALIVNGQAVASIQPDGHFRHFTEALNPGSHEIVITGQNRRGGTAITRVPIVVPK